MAPARGSQENDALPPISFGTTQAGQFERARAARATAIHEDHVEAIADLIGTGGGRS